MTKGEVTPPVPVPGGAEGGMSRRELTGQPVFRCPSDVVSAQWQWHWHTYETAGRKLRFSAYDDVGTSFQMNFYWWQQTDKAPGQDRDGDGVVEPLPGKCDKEETPGCPDQKIDWPCRFRQGRQVWRKYMEKDAARFVTLVEDPFDYGIIEGIQTMGFHGQFSRHNLAFLDGHVAHVSADTRKMSGRDWTVLDESMEACQWP
jgi:prepilin-type processing-associated H-X9-DG protein